MWDICPKFKGIILNSKKINKLKDQFMERNPSRVIRWMSGSSAHCTVLPAVLLGAVSCTGCAHSPFLAGPCLSLRSGHRDALSLVSVQIVLVSIIQSCCSWQQCATDGAWSWLIFAALCPSMAGLHSQTPGEANCAISDLAFGKCPGCTR